MALVSGLVSLGRIPRCVLEIDASKVRLSRIIDLMRKCRASLHDLSRVECDQDKSGHYPRFNMPLECGMAFAVGKLNRQKHSFFIFESKSYRVMRTTSDLNGMDAYIHRGTPEGMLEALRSCVGGQADDPSAADMIAHAHLLTRAAEIEKASSGGSSIFSRAIFKKLVATALAVPADVALIEELFDIKVRAALPRSIVAKAAS